MLFCETGYAPVCTFRFFCRACTSINMSLKYKLCRRSERSHQRRLPKKQNSKKKQNREMNKRKPKNANKTMKKQKARKSSKKKNGQKKAAKRKIDCEQVAKFDLVTHHYIFQNCELFFDSMADINGKTTFFRVFPILERIGKLMIWTIFFKQC